MVKLVTGIVMVQLLEEAKLKILKQVSGLKEIRILESLWMARKTALHLKELQKRKSNM